MSVLRFELTREFPHPPLVLFSALCNWPEHARWIPLTRVELHPGPAQDAQFEHPVRQVSLGEEFTATSGLGPLALVDRMVVVEAPASTRRVRLRKIGPVLTGFAELEVLDHPTDPARSRVRWHEEIELPLPLGPLRHLLARLTVLGFTLALRRLARHLRATSTQS